MQQDIPWPCNGVDMPPNFFIPDYIGLVHAPMQAYTQSTYNAMPYAGPSLLLGVPTPVLGF